MTSKKGSGGSGKLVLGFLLGVLAAGAGGFAYLRFGGLPAGMVDRPSLLEKRMKSLPLRARVDQEKKTPPFGTSEDAFEAGAHVYKKECANCHGTPGHDVAFARPMYPVAPQLWKKHGKSGTAGVSADTPGETYSKVANGMQLKGMPAYKHVLTEAQMWQVSLLLANADKELPLPVIRILSTP